MNGSWAWWLATGGGLALIAFLFWLWWRRCGASVVRPAIRKLMDATEKSLGVWQSQGAKDVDKEIGEFSFFAKDGSVKAEFSTSGQTAEITIDLADTVIIFYFVDGVLNSISCPNQSFGTDHFETRQNRPLARKLWQAIRRKVGFYVGPDEEDLKVREYADLSKRKKLDYGRKDGDDEDDPPKKRRKRNE